MLAVATYNTGKGTKTLRDLNRLRTEFGVSVIAGQEMSVVGRNPKSVGVRAFLKAVGWSHFGVGSQPVLWDSKVWDVVSTETVPVYPDTWVGPAGAGPATLTARNLNVVVLREKTTGKTAAFTSIHFPPSIRNRSVPEENRERRESLARTYVTAIAAYYDRALAGKVDAVFILGDFNLQPKDPILAPLRKRLVLDDAPRGTHGDRVIDHVYRSKDLHEVGATLVPTGFTSDHRPRVLRYSLGEPVSRTFKAATWNVYHSTPVAELRPILRALKEDGVSLILFQEISRKDVREMIRDEGYRLAFHPRQYGVAYLPEVWKGLSDEGVRLGATGYFRKGGSSPQFSEAVRAVLQHVSGKTLDTLSYHTPAHVQPDLGTSVPRRLQALRESMATLKVLADEKRADAVLYGGDDNVDEFKGNGSASGFWAFMLYAATGLVQVRAPKPTHGHPEHGRKIDDFRVRGLKVVGTGSVHDGGGDHRVYAQDFSFR